MTTAEKLIKVAENVPKVYEAGFEAGKAEGGDSYYDTLWDDIQDYGKRTNYTNTFRAFRDGATELTEKTFIPKYDIIPTTSNDIFHGSVINCDLVELMERCGRVLDFSNTTGLWEGFADTKFTRVGVINASKVLGKRQFFRNSTLLKTIDEYIPPTILESYITDGVFDNCISLENITIGGTILDDLSFVSSPLTATSAISVITHLENYAGTENEFTYTVTFSATTWDYLDAEGNASPNGNTWREYINDLGWNAS